MTSRKDNAPEVESSSPACSMHQADDAYMGYAGKEELTAILTELLEEERAGVRVAHESALTARGGPLGKLMRAIEKDDARWCAMLAGHLRMLGQPPSSKLGAFYEKAMAIGDLGERIAFLNRGQGWVVRKLRELLPRVRDNSLHTDLSEMLRSHEANIALAPRYPAPPHSTHLIDLRLSPSREIKR
jgi:hypothetical protein